MANRLGVRTTAILSDMNQPLGRMVGHAVEVQESMDVLRGDGPQDVRDLTVALGARLLVAEGIDHDHEAAGRRLESTLDDGSARERFEKMVAALNGVYSEAGVEMLAHGPGVISRRTFLRRETMGGIQRGFGVALLMIYALLWYFASEKHNIHQRHSCQQVRKADVGEQTHHARCQS